MARTKTPSRGPEVADVISNELSITPDKRPAKLKACCQINSINCIAYKIKVA